MMLCGLSAESWTTKPPLLANFAIPRKIRVHRLVYCCFRLCGSIFEDYSCRSCPFVMFFKYSFEKYRVLCRSRNVKRNWSRFGCENQRLLFGKARRTSKDIVITPIASLRNSCFVGRVQFRRLTAFRSEEATDLAFVE